MEHIVSTLLQDLRYSMRLLWNKRTYSITVVLMLGLGIGAFTSVFAVANAVLLKSYGPVKTDQWVYLWEHRTKSASLNQISVSMANFQPSCGRPTRQTDVLAARVTGRKD